MRWVVGTDEADGLPFAAHVTEHDLEKGVRHGNAVLPYRFGMFGNDGTAHHIDLAEKVGPAAHTVLQVIPVALVEGVVLRTDVA